MQHKLLFIKLRNMWIKKIEKELNNIRTFSIEFLWFIWEILSLFERLSCSSSSSSSDKNNKNQIRSYEYTHKLLNFFFGKYTINYNILHLRQ